MNVADVLGGNPFCDAVGVDDGSPFCGAAADVAVVNPSCGVADVAPVCYGWYETAQTAADAAADKTDPWGSPGGTRQLETENAAAGAPVFSEDTGSLCAPVASSEAPFECEVASASVRTCAGYVMSAEELGSAGSKGHPDHSEQQSQGCHGDGGGNAPVQCCFSHHCFCCPQQICHFFAAVAAVDGGAVDAAVSLVTSLAGSPAQKWTHQNLHFLPQHWMWHCGYV